MRLYDLAKPLLFRVDPERAHSWGMFFAKFLSQVDSPKTLARKTSFGEIKNPIGLAAGFDKTGKHLSTLQKFGFGYIVAGTITKDPLPGHPKPRIVRIPSEQTLLNCLGFPNPGVDEFIANIKEQKINVPVIASISGQDEPSILECYEKIQPCVAGIELNLSSPNTPSLKDLREKDAFQSLSRKILGSKKKPTFLKVPPFYNEEQSLTNLELIKTWNELGFEGVTAGNAVPIKDSRLSVGNGGLSGPPLLGYTINAIQAVRKSFSQNFEINSVGGISGPEDVKKALNEGASTVQLYTSLIYGGPGLIGRMIQGLH